MADKKKVFSNKQQLEKLVAIMESHPNIAKGIFKKREADSHWKKFAEKLNSMGPPIKTPEKWMKVWIDLKAKTKKKLIHNKKELKTTGGGPNNLHYFSPIEETVISLLNLNTCVDSPGQDFVVCATPEVQREVAEKRISYNLEELDDSVETSQEEIHPSAHSPPEESEPVPCTSTQETRRCNKVSPGERYKLIEIYVNQLGEKSKNENNDSQQLKQGRSASQEKRFDLKN